MNKELLLVVDFGAHNNQQVAKIARQSKVYCEVKPDSQDLEKLNPKAVIVVGDDEVDADLSKVKSLKVPVLEKGNLKSVEEIESFIKVCGFTCDWTVDAFIEDAVKQIRETVGDKKVLCALSGGVDSSVCAALVYKAIGNQLTCMFVNHGLMRKGEPELIDQIFGRQFGMPLITINAVDRFLEKLDGVDEPERKRKIIGEEFIRVFEEESRKLGKMDFLVQGTIYPDIIESVSNKGVVKSHHNVGGLPEDIDFQLLEPVKWLFKDEVRAVGEALGLPHEQVWRQPFPGPGLGVRVVGAITRDKLEFVRESDAILREEIAKAGLDQSIWQYFTVCPGCKSVGVKDGKRTYEQAIAIRAILSSDAMSADVAELPYPLLNKIACRIVAEVDGVNRVMYDITPKPPATIEWE
ncbi:MAG: glutamine-hydrolyzing GMP synthase [Eubacteriales bacterium]|nr:glutamine-hydrolyzing GMP synthase [Eubacteriales bacterium]